MFVVIKSNDSVIVNIIIELKGVVFDENRLNSISKPKEYAHLVEENDEEKNLESGRSKRVRKEKTFGSNFFMFLVEGTREFFSKYII